MVITLCSSFSGLPRLCCLPLGTCGCWSAERFFRLTRIVRYLWRIAWAVRRRSLFAPLTANVISGFLYAEQWCGLCLPFATRILMILGHFRVRPQMKTRDNRCPGRRRGSNWKPVLTIAFPQSEPVSATALSLRQTDLSTTNCPHGDFTSTKH
jgi:hypothetical protein